MPRARSAAPRAAERPAAQEPSPQSDVTDAVAEHQGKAPSGPRRTLRYRRSGTGEPFFRDSSVLLIGEHEYLVPCAQLAIAFTATAAASRHPVAYCAWSPSDRAPACRNAYETAAAVLSARTLIDIVTH